MRLFVAIEAPESWRAEAQRIQASLSGAVRQQVRLVDPANMHITLRFIGEVDESSVPALREALARSLPPVEVRLELDRIGTFGAPARTSVVWLGICGDVEGLRTLARRADEAVMSALGLVSEDRPCSPHITLARVRQQISLDQRRHIAEAVRALDPPTAPVFVAHEAVLIRSHLGAGGSRYEVLGRWG